MNKAEILKFDFQNIVALLNYFLKLDSDGPQGTLLWIEQLFKALMKSGFQAMSGLLMNSTFFA